MDNVKDYRTDSYLDKRVVISALFLQLLCFVDSADSHLYQVTEDSCHGNTYNRWCVTAEVRV